MPPEFIDTPNIEQGIREAQASRKRAAVPIWDLGRVRVWQIVKRIVVVAGIPDAPHRAPNGLSHGVGIDSTVNGAPLHMVQKWMGHAQPSRTAICADAVDETERGIAAGMWGVGAHFSGERPRSRPELQGAP